VSDVSPFDIDRPLIMAHRGDSARFPENTMLSLEAAANIGVDVLETDVHLTRDDELVLFHDDDLMRTTGHGGKIREKTLEELQRIDLGAKYTPDGETYPFRGQGLTVVTLREALERFSDLRFNIDIKDTLGHAPEVLREIIVETERERSVIVASFHPRQVQRFRALAPQVPTAASSSEVKRFVLALKLRLLRPVVRNTPYDAFQVPVRSGSIGIVNRRFIEAAHHRGIAVHVWTINDREEMTRLIDIGVDGIFTDRPALLREVMIDKGLL